MHRVVTSAIVLALLGGCAASPRLAPPAGRQFDGVYRGNTTLLRGWGFPCGDPHLPHEITVRNGSFAYPFQLDPPLEMPVAVRIAADGSFYRAEQYPMLERLFPSDPPTAWITVRGRIVGSTLDATEKDLRCDRRSLLVRR